MKSILLVALFISTANSAFAVDGQVLINQSTVMAAGGFPYAINQSGSYKLSGDLSVPSGSDGIHINASNVMLDLNGFSITTPTQSTQTTFLPAQGISAVPPFGSAIVISGVTICNGKVRGFIHPIVSAAGNIGWTLENLFLNWGLPGSSSILELDAYSRIERVNSPDVELRVVGPSVIAFSAAPAMACVNVYDGGNPPNSPCGLVGNSTK